MDPKFLLLSVAMPAAISTAAVAGAFFLSKRKPDHPIRRWAGPVAIALPFIVASPAILGHGPEWPPAQAADWLPFLGLAALLIGLVDVLVRPRYVSTVLTGLFLAGFAAMVLRGPLASAMTNSMGDGATKTAWIFGVVALYVVPGLLARSGAAATPNAGPPFALGLLTAMVIGWALLSETAKYAQFASLVGLGLAPLGIVTLIARPWSIARGAVPAFVALNTTLWLLVSFYAERSDLAVVLGSMAPAALAVSRIPALKDKAKVAGFVQIAAVVALGLAAVGASMAARPPKPAAGPDYSDAYK